MRRIASVLMPTKKDDGRRSKRSWKSWLRRRPPHTDRATDDDDDSTTSTIPLQSLISFTAESLLVPPSVAPFAPDSLFPRSVGEPGLPPRPSLRIHVLKSAVLHRYGGFRQDEQPYTVSDFPNISRPPVSSSSSPCIRRWLSRPCFEDRNVIYTPLESDVVMSRVSGSMPVAAIEFSDYLEFMADPGVLQPVTPVTVDPLPSPQRNQLPPSPPSSDKSDSPPPMTPISPPATTVKRVVRFAADTDQDDDDEDGVPLHLIRQKKLREQKAKFIRQERIRRAREEEVIRRQQEKEILQRQREQDRLEAQRARAEKERKQKEQTILTGEVVKARLRREQHRAGGVPALVMRDRENGLNLGGVSSSSLAAGERNKPHLPSPSSTASLRVVQTSTSNNPWKDASVDPASHLQTQHQQSASDSSPGSSRRSSILASPSNTPSPLYQSHFNSRPPSSYSSSSESIGKHNSLMHLMGSPMMSPMAMPMNMMPTYGVPQPIIMTYPPFASSNPNISYNPSQVIPPFVPVSNSFMSNDIDMRMPLLPPTAPFMKQPSYERRKSSDREGGDRNSRPASLRSSADSKRDSVAFSSERVTSMFDRERERQSFSAAIPRTGKPSGLGDTRKPVSGRPGQNNTQRRSSSGPVISSSTTARGKQGQPTRASTMPVLPPLPSPWTGVPTAQQRQQAQIAMSNDTNKSGQSVSGASSSTVTKRPSIMSGIGLGKSIIKSKNKPSINSNQGRSQAIIW